MAEQPNKDVKLGAEPGKGAAGDQWAVQVAQPVGDAVSPPGTRSMPGGQVEENKADIEATRQSEEGSGMTTADGYVIDDSGRLNNFAVEPEMYVEE